MRASRWEISHASGVKIDLGRIGVWFELGPMWVTVAGLTRTCTAITCQAKHAHHSTISLFLRLDISIPRPYFQECPPCQFARLTMPELRR